MPRLKARGRTQSPALLIAGTHDAAAIAELHAKCFARGWAEKDMRIFLESPSCLCLTANMPGADLLSGLVLVRADGAQAEILTLAVAPNFRRRGIATALLEELVVQLRRSQVEHVFLEVAAGSPAILFYERQGFISSGTRKNYYPAASGGCREDAIVMAKGL